MLRLLALTCLLLLAMLCLLEGSASVQNGRAVSADANVAPETVNIGRRVILVADFDVRSEDSASALHHGPAVFPGISQREHIDSLRTEMQFGKPKFQHGRIGGNAGVSLPRLRFSIKSDRLAI